MPKAVSRFVPLVVAFLGGLLVLSAVVYLARPSASPAYGHTFLSQDEALGVVTQGRFGVTRLAVDGVWLTGRSVAPRQRNRCTAVNAA